MAGNFIKCPRCELNYIDKTKQTYCDVCLAELKLGPSLKFADLDEEEDMEAMELCPVCKQNYMKYNEEMCEDCKKEKEFEKDDIDLDEDEGWKDFIDETEDIAEETEIPLSQLEEEEDEFFDDEEDLDEAEDDELDDIDEDFDDEDLDGLDDEDEDEDEEDEEDDE